MSLSKLARRILGSQYVILEDAGYLSEDLKLTDAGRTALDHIVLEKFETELVASAKDLLERRKEEEKKNK